MEYPVNGDVSKALRPNGLASVQLLVLEFSQVFLEGFYRTTGTLTVYGPGEGGPEKHRAGCT